jgi:hypothetical protein
VYELETDIEIAATPDAVWAVLTDFAAYPDWNPFVRSISGPLEPGQRLKVAARPPGWPTIPFRPLVLGVVPGESFSWRGTVLANGFFNGVHTFRIEPLGGGRVRFTQHEVGSGFIAPAVRLGLAAATRRGFEAMDRALEQRVKAAGR